MRVKSEFWIFDWLWVTSEKNAMIPYTSPLVLQHTNSLVHFTSIPPSARILIWRAVLSVTLMDIATSTVGSQGFRVRVRVRLRVRIRWRVRDRIRAWGERESYASPQDSKRAAASYVISPTPFSAPNNPVVIPTKSHLPISSKRWSNVTTKVN